ncbi:MAG: hypothetical protein JKY71_08325, partial [Alphaproteobacteria bacterium]|nr:hypothetical protein [Alphaproteobacteria bacterium]
MSNLSDRRGSFVVDPAKFQAKINSMSVDELFTEFAPPIAHIMLPKQKALSRIMRDVLNQGSVFMKATTDRADHSYAVDMRTGGLYRVSVEHTEDALEMIIENSGLVTARGRPEELIPTVAIVGYDGYESVRMKRAAEDQFTPVSLFGKMQTTRAGLVFAAKDPEHLRNLENERKIAVARTYEPLYSQFLEQAFGKDHGVHVRGFKGGVESKPFFLPGVNVIGDLTDSGGSLKELDYSHVIDVSDSAPVIVSHVDMREHVTEDYVDRIRELSHHLRRASALAFPDETLFEPSEAVIWAPRRRSR